MSIYNQGNYSQDTHEDNVTKNDVFTRVQLPEMTWLFNQLEKSMLTANASVQKRQRGALQFSKKSNLNTPYIPASACYNIQLTRTAAFEGQP